MAGTIYRRESRRNDSTRTRAFKAIAAGFLAASCSAYVIRDQPANAPGAESPVSDEPIKIGRRPTLKTSCDDSVPDQHKCKIISGGNIAREGLNIIVKDQGMDGEKPRASVDLTKEGQTFLTLQAGESKDFSHNGWNYEVETTVNGFTKEPLPPSVTVMVIITRKAPMQQCGDSEKPFELVEDKPMVTEKANFESGGLFVQVEGVVKKDDGDVANLFIDCGESSHVPMLKQGEEFRFTFNKTDHVIYAPVVQHQEGGDGWAYLKLYRGSKCE